MSHAKNVDNLISLLLKYKEEIKNDDHKSDSEYFQVAIDNSIEDLKDKLRMFYNSIQDNLEDPELIKEVDEYQNNIQNMKELYPIIINYLIQKNYY